MRRCFIGSPHRLELPRTGEMGLGVVRLDLDGRLEPLEGGLGVSLGVLDRTEPDQGTHKIRIKLEGFAEARFRLVQPALEHQDLAQPLMDFGGTGNLGGQLQELHLRLFQVAPVNGRLGAFTDLLHVPDCSAVGGECGFPRHASDQLHPAMAASRLNDRHLIAIEAPPRMASRPLPWGGPIVSPGPGSPCDPFRQTGKRPGKSATRRTLRRGYNTVNAGYATWQSAKPASTHGPFRPDRSSLRPKVVLQLEVEGELNNRFEDDGIDHTVKAVGGQGVVIKCPTLAERLYCRPARSGPPATVSDSLAVYESYISVGK